MDTTTLAAFWEGVASSSGNMIFNNSTFWILLGQVVLVIGVISALFVALVKGLGHVSGRKGRRR